jgi:hypothetical protein
MKYDMQKIISDIILKNNIDITSIKKLIKSYNYNIDDIFYNLAFPTLWKGKYKSAYSDLRYLIDNIYQFFEEHSEYKNIDNVNFKKNILEIIYNFKK